MATNKDHLYEAMQDHYDKMVEHLKNTLPSGSGINDDWRVEYTASKHTFYCRNTYSVMCENGYYVGYVKFSFIIPVGCEARLVLHGSEGHYLARKYALREYLEDLLFGWYKEEV